MVIARTMQARVYATSGWPTGFCPLHVFEHDHCTSSCWPLRESFALAARALDAYWLSNDRHLYVLDLANRLVRERMRPRSAA